MKRAQGVMKGNPAALVIIFTILIGIVGYFVILPPPLREGYLSDIPSVDYENVILDASPGKIESGSEGQSIRKLDLPSVTVDNTPQTQSRFVSDHLLIKKSLFQATYVDYDFDIDTSTFAAARLHFTVAEKTGDGVLIVRTNQRTVFSRAVGTGETLDITLPKYYLHEGANTIRISVLGSGAKFWQVNSYVLTDGKLEVDNYLSESAEQSLTLSRNTAKNLDEARLSAYIKQLGKSVNLKLELNDEQIFYAIPAKSFSLDLSQNLLRDGYNSLKWSSDPDGKYAVTYGVITIEEIEIEEGGKRYYFAVSEKDMYFVNQPSKYTCELFMLKESGPDEIAVSINSDTKNYDFESGEIREDICDFLKEGTNKITFSVDEDIVISDLIITIKNEE